MLRATKTDRIGIAEAERLAAQALFDQEVPPSERNIQGQFATPPTLADAMVRLARKLCPELVPVRLLDPGGGTGTFFSSVLRTYGPDGIASATTFETDPRLASVMGRLWAPFCLNVQSADFTKASPPQLDGDKPNLIICNPPYVRHHHLEVPDKTRMKKRVGRLGLELNGLAGLYCYFLLLADEWLAPGGTSVFIVPAEFLDVNYGSVVKQYLRDRVTTVQIHRFSPEDVQFADALVTSVIVLYRKSATPQRHEILLTSGPNLLAPTFTRRVPARQLDHKDKWGRFFSPGESLIRSTGHAKLGDLFSIKRGIATGANDFFILEEAAAQQLGLPNEFLRPVLPGQRFIPSDVIEANPDGLPIGIPRLFLLDCPLPRRVVSRSFPALDRYLRKGKRQHLPERYLLRGRSPWYSQEQRPPAPIICTYMGRKKKNGCTFRFIRNYSRATSVNVYLLLYPKPQLQEAIQSDGAVLERVFDYLRSLRNIESAGRVYGGGLNKLEPKELAQVEIPKEMMTEIQTLANRQVSMFGNP